MAKKKSNTRQLLLAVTVGAVIGAAGFSVGKASALNDFLPSVSPVEVIASAITAILLAFATHELGHLVIGMMQGFRFYLFVAGPLGVRRTEDNKIKVYLNTDLSLAGGVASTAPTQQSQNTVQKQARILLGGPVTSLFFAITSLLLFWLLSTMTLFWLLFGIMSFLIFLATTVPTKAGFFFTDRARYQRLMGKGKEAEIELVLLNATNLVMATNQYRDLNLNDLNLLTNSQDDYYQFMGLLYKLYYYKEHDHRTEHDEQLKQLSNFKGVVPNLLYKMIEQEKYMVN